MIFSKRKDNSDRELIGGCLGLGVKGGTEKDYEKVQLFWMMQRFCIPTAEAVTRTHTWTEVQRTVHQRNNFYCVPVIHSLPLCSTFTLHCLLQNNESRPFTYLLCQQAELGALAADSPGEEEAVLPSCFWCACSTGSGSTCSAPQAWLLLHGWLLWHAAPTAQAGSRASGPCTTPGCSRTQFLQRGAFSTPSPLWHMAASTPRGQQCPLVTTPWVVL